MQAIPRSGDPHRFVYSLEAKRDWRNRVRYAVPPELPAAALAAVERAAASVFAALGCRDVARIDFRVTRDGRPVFLEANPLPGLSPEKGDIVIATRAAGISYDALIAAIIERAAGEAARTQASRESTGAVSLPRAWPASHPISEV
jgi:D-alanine-D-alanine ligase